MLNGEFKKLREEVRGSREEVREKSKPPQRSGSVWFGFYFYLLPLVSNLFPPLLELAPPLIAIPQKAEGRGSRFEGRGEREIKTVRMGSGSGLVWFLFLPLTSCLEPLPSASRTRLADGIHRRMRRGLSIQHSTFNIEHFAFQTPFSTIPKNRSTSAPSNCVPAPSRSFVKASRVEIGIW